MKLRSKETAEGGREEIRLGTITHLIKARKTEPIAQMSSLSLHFSPAIPWQSSGGNESYFH